MARRLRPVGHDDRLSVVDHLDELRSRLIVSLFVFVVAFGICFWQNHLLLEILNRPLERSTPNASSDHNAGRLANNAAAQAKAAQGLRQASRASSRLALSSGLSAADRKQMQELSRGLASAAAALPKSTPPREPITTGVAEPFTQTVLVAAYFALILSLPVILFQIYAFVLPAFSRKERRVALPLMLMVPVLFVCGVLFGYFAVLPPAINFLQNFNSNNFDILIRAHDYYSFSILVLLVMGLVFQVPVGSLALGRAGIISSRTLTGQWRYAIVGIAVVAAALPGVDPVSMVLEMVPLIGLYVLSILLLKLSERRRRKSADAGLEVLPAVGKHDD